MGRFTSIFHEEVICIDEFKEEIKAAHAARRNAEKMSHAAGHKGFHSDKSAYFKEKEHAEKIRDKGEHRNRPAKTKYDVENRKRDAEVDKNTYDRDNARRQYDRDKKKKDLIIAPKGNSNDRKRVRNAQKESFLPEIELI